MSSTSVAVVGAGLTGLSTAFHLRKAGVEHRIVERCADPGGLAVTTEEQGYRFDRTGHVLHLADDEIRTLALSWLGSEHLLVERRAAIWSNGGYTRYPFQANLHGLPPRVAHECLLGFIEAEQTRRAPNPSAAPPQSFEEFSLATFGRGISEHFMLPYNSRMWGVAPSEITAAWCQRFVPVPTMEDVVAGAVGLEDRKLGYNATFFYPRRGIGELTERLAQDVGGVELGCEVRAIHTGPRQLELDGEAIRYDALVSTMPLPELIARCEDAPEAVRAAARRLRCTHLYYLDVALHQPSGQPYHWVYVPEERYPFYRVGSYSNISSAMAPEGKGSLYVELVDRDEPDLGQTLPEVAMGLCEMGIIDSPAAIQFAQLRRIDHAYVVFDHHTYPALAVIEPFLHERRILSRGRYGGWNYSSMGDALRFGRDAAAEATAMIRGVEGERS